MSHSVVLPTMLSHSKKSPIAGKGRDGDGEGMPTTDANFWLHL